MMESVGELGGLDGSSSNLLSLPAHCPWDEDEESLGLEGIRPKSSPVPRRRSSVSSDDSQSPPSSSRKVSFADAFGLSLVSVKQFDTWEVTVPPDPLDSDLNEAMEYYMVPLIALPLSEDQLDLRVHRQNIELENLELLPRTTTLRGVIRVLNLCFDKMVYVRTSLDSWRSHFDLLAEYVPGSPNGEMDCFSFKLTLVPPFGEEGARVDFCLRYETSLGTFWANNDDKNYTVYCYEKSKEKSQNESENRRKSCLKGTSSNISALSAATTNNEEFPDIIVNSGQESCLESQNTHSEELQKENKELKEEISRNRSRRNKRKAARLAKVKEHFARKEEEKKQGTKATGSEVTAESSMQEHASVLVREPCSLSQQTPAGPPACNQIAFSPAECLKSTEHTGDSTVTFKQQTLEQHVQDTVIHCETDLSGEQANSSQEDTDDLSDQTDPLDQPVPGRQNYDSSAGEDVEKAWKDFEQISGLTQSSKMDKDANTAHRENVCLKTSHSVPQLFSHNYTFGTIVAPLYHQVFKNMETERKDFIQRAFQVDRTFWQQEHGNLRPVTPPESDQAPVRQHTETESCVSIKQTQHDSTDGESTEPNSPNPMKQTTNPFSDPVQQAVSSHNYQNDYCSGITKHSTDIKYTEDTQNQEDPTYNQSTVENITLQPNTSTSIENNLTLNINNQFPEESHNSGNIDFVVPQNDFNNSQTQQITSILNQSPAETPSQSTVSEVPKMLETSSMILDSSDDKLEHVCSEMNFNNEIINCSKGTVKLPEPYTESDRTQINTNNDKINESKEQIIAAFDSQDSKPDTCSIFDDTKHFDGEDDNTTLIKDTENIQKEELVTKNEEELCHISKGLVEEENRNQIMQMENQEVEEDQGRQEELEGVEEGQEAKVGGINNIADEFRYIDDDEDMDMGTVEIEKNDSVIEQSQLVNQQSESVNQELDSVNQELDSVNQELDSVNQHPQSDSDNQLLDSVNHLFDSVNWQSELVIHQSESMYQQLDSVHQQSLERQPEKQELVIIKSNVELIPQNDIELHNAEEQQSTAQSQGGREERDSSSEAEETGEETDTSGKESTQSSGTALSASMQGNKKDLDHLEFIDKDENVCESEKLQNEQHPDDENIQENMECQSKDTMNRDIEKDAEDNTSTESLVDDEMELYLTSLKNSQQSVFKEGMMNVNYGRRPSLSRGRSMSLTMPSISESVDEDQPNSSLENTSNTEDIMELERATLLLLEGNEPVVGRNVLWWKEFLSYDNMSRVVGYSFLLILFFVVAYYYDFIACFALYLLTVYWLFQQGEGEPVKSSRRGKRLQ